MTDDRVWKLVPVEPSWEHIESMALRYDHGHDAKVHVFDSKQMGFRLETDSEFEGRREANRRLARQMYEEAIGEGFFHLGRPQ